MEQHGNLSAEKIVRENNSSRKYNKDENVNRICKKNSAIHSISLFEIAFPASREKAQDDIQQEKGPLVQYHQLQILRKMNRSEMSCNF